MFQHVSCIAAAGMAPQRRRAARLAALAALGATVAVAQAPPAAPPPEGEPPPVEVVHATLRSAPGHRDVREVRRLRQGGGRLDWSQQGDRIAYERAGADGLYDVYVMEPDGLGERCLTCDNYDLRRLNVLDPAWHPSGDYLVVQVQSYAKKLGMGTAELATPFRGLHSDLRLITRDGRQLWQLTPTGGAVAGAFFSHEAGQLAWSERLTDRSAPWGEWGVRVGEFRVRRGVPRLGKVETFQPAPPRGWLAASAFTPNDRGLLITVATAVEQPDSPTEVDTLELESGRFVPFFGRALERQGVASYAPRGDRVVFTSDRGIARPSTPRLPRRNDLWVRSPEGTVEERLTFFNQRGSDHDLGEAMIDDLAWSPDGDRLALHVVSAVAGGEVEEAIYLVVLADSYRR